MTQDIIGVRFRVPGDRYTRVFYDSMMVANDRADEPLFEIEYSGRAVVVSLKQLVDAVLDRLTMSAIANANIESDVKNNSDIDTDGDDGSDVQLDELPERFYHCECEGKRVSMRDYHKWLVSADTGVETKDGPRPSFYPKTWVNGVCTECRSVLKAEGDIHELVSSSYGGKGWNHS